MAYGLRLKSDQPIPGLVPQAEPQAVDVEVCHGETETWWRRISKMPRELWDTGTPVWPSGVPGYKAWYVAGGQYLLLQYYDGCQFLINRPCTRVWVTGPEAANSEYLATYLLGPVVGRLLRLRGTNCLHGSAVAADGFALSVLGYPGAGKSTTAAAFARLGYPVFTDDITVLREEGDIFWVVPGDPNVCLWPQSVTYLYGSPSALPPIISDNTLEPEWDKRGLNLTGPGYRFQSRPLPLGAIYILWGRQEDSDSRVEEVPGKEKLLLLIANTYGSGLLDKELRAREFEALGRLLERVPVRRLIPRAGPAHLNQLCEAILSDFFQLRSKREDPLNNLSLPA